MEKPAASIFRVHWSWRVEDSDVHTVQSLNTFNLVEYWGAVVQG